MRDLQNVETELVLSDLMVVEKRLERVDKDRKKVKNPDMDREAELLEKCKATLERDTPLRELTFDAEEEKRIRGFQFLSQKPMLYVLNLGEEDASRRTVYVFLKRSMIVPMLDVMDLCDTARSAARRQNTSVATQALTLFNGEFVNTQARYLAQRLRREAGEDAGKQIELAWRLALARPPKPGETAAMIEFLKREPLEQMCRVILNWNEFVYPD